MVPWGEVGQTLPDPNVVTFVIGQLGTVAALVWYLWFQTSKEIPKARLDFLNALQEQRAEHTRRVNGFTSEQAKIWAELHQLVLANQDLSDAVREAIELRRPKRPTPPAVSPP